MFTPGLEDYGYGWTIRSSDTGPTVEHGGGINGFNTLITRNPESKRLIILLNNTGGAPLAEMARSIRMLLDGDPPPPPKQPAAPRLLETYDAAGLGATLALAGVMQTGSVYEAGDDQLARLARHLLNTGAVKDGLELADTLFQNTPTSANRAALLAQAYQANGHRIEAAQHYGLSIALSDTPRSFLVYTDAIRQLATPEQEGE